LEYLRTAASGVAKAFKSIEYGYKWGTFAPGQEANKPLKIKGQRLDCGVISQNNQKKAVKLIYYLW
jgi:hypothetical protein